jgi:hypothetical protein
MSSRAAAGVVHPDGEHPHLIQMPRDRFPERNLAVKTGAGQANTRILQAAEGRHTGRHQHDQRHDQHRRHERNEQAEDPAGPLRQVDGVAGDWAGQQHLQRSALAFAASCPYFAEYRLPGHLPTTGDIVAEAAR